MQAWTWARASYRGVSHVKQGTRRQDALSCLGATPGTLVAIVSDGAGSASHGGEGASVTVRILMRRALDHVRRTNSLPDDDTIWTWTDEVRDRLARAAAERNIDRKNFAATLVGVISTGEATAVFHVGDGAAVGRNAKTGAWETLSWPENGEYASTTYFMTDNPSIRLRITRIENTLNAVVVFSDGIERLALSFTESVPHAPFFNGIVKAIDDSSVTGCDLILSQKLVRYLDSPAINERTDDDKSLIIAVLR